MKKTFTLLTVLLLIVCTFTGCTDNTSPQITVPLADNPIEGEKLFELSRNGTVTIAFDVPETGYIKLVAYDGTEYIEWPDEIPDIYVDFKTESGKTLYKGISISDGYFEKYKFEAGKVIAKITAKNRPKEMKKLCLSWAYAADNYEPVDIDFETDFAAAADKNGTAHFKLYVDKASLIRISPTEACVYDSDCSFYVETANGEKVSGDLSIHGTEWASRLVFLDKGEYVIVVNEISAVASCRATIEKSYTAIQLDDADGMTVPVIFGLNALNNGERTVKFTANGTPKYLVVDTRGEGTFYDSVHYVDVVITDSNGNVVAQTEEDDCVSDEIRIDISEFSGEYTVTLSTGGSCVTEISVIDKTE